MHIIVTIKQVPDTHEITIDPEKGTLNREGVPSIINPEDKNALEAALALRKIHGGKITVLSMGPPQAEKALREAMSMGADEAILLTDKDFAGADTLATSYALSCAIKKIANYDLIISGRQAIDGDTAQTGPQIAEFLKIPQITYVCGLEITDGIIRAKSAFDDLIRTVEAKLPALITVTKDMNIPRYPSLPGIIKAFREKKVTLWSSRDVNAMNIKIGLCGSPTQVWKTFSPKHGRKGRIFKGSDDELVENLKDVLKANKFI